MNRYQRFVTGITFAGWILVQFDSNMFFLSYPSIMKELNVPLTMIGVLLAIGMVASWLLSFLAGPAMDYIGRKFVLQLSLLFAAVGSVFTAVSWNWGSLIVARAIVQGTSSAEMPAGLTIAGEEVPARYRGTVVGLIQTGYPVGFFLASWMASWIIPLYGWRMLFFIGVAPLVAVIVARFWLREPPRNVEVMELRRAKRTETEHKVDAEKAKRLTLAQLFAPDLLKQTILLGLCVIFMNFGAAGILFFMPAIVPALGFTLEQFYTVSIWGTAFGILGYLSCAFLGERIGRRKAVLYYIILAIISLILLAYFASSYGLLILFYVCFWVFGMGTYSAQMGYFLEVYPTRARGTAISFLTSCMWAANTATSFLGPYFLQGFGPIGTLVIYGAVCWTISLLCFVGVREVAPGQELEAIAT